ncbi:signal transduction histidine kinase [Lipingzhangella halophila]|uniref:histidine kinase n=1 Tax=Lipingzhangella halophila TaxID=1783352 RepID=A0A7W7W457_9ACTN|nr:sensor histidine kinase [Lipingzhangella halophila]MBB4933466.1 signal transduction histidine kinase [Lipingzhangella halophila]
MRGHLQRALGRLLSPPGPGTRGTGRRVSREDLLLTLAFGFFVGLSTMYADLAAPASENQPLLPWGLALIALAVVPLAVRNVYPFPVAAVSASAATVYYPLNHPDGAVIVAGAFALYTAVARGYRWLGWLLGLTQFLIVHIWEAVAFGSPRLEYAAGMFAWMLVVLVAGEVARKRTEYNSEQRARREEAEHAREEEMRRRSADERVRLAREVHDVIAHNISLINVQAGTALYLMDSEPERARDALSTIKTASKETLQELRSTLGTLRSADEAAPRSPPAGVDRIPELVERTRAAGIDVDLRSEGEPRRLGAHTDAASYRIVQEALTNAVRHAGATAISVRLRYDKAALAVEIEDNGSGAPYGFVSGNGIAGMRERAAALGGDLHAAPVKEGGFRVRARLPDNGIEDT